MSHQIVNPPRATEVMLRPDVTNSLDNNGVDLDREMARLTDNSTKYQTMVESARRRYAIITEVISTMSQG
jgi:flagellar basal-body rod protein FlgB